MRTFSNRVHSLLNVSFQDPFPIPPLSFFSLPTLRSLLSSPSSFIIFFLAIFSPIRLRLQSGIPPFVNRLNASYFQLRQERFEPFFWGGRPSPGLQSFLLSSRITLQAEAFLPPPRIFRPPWRVFPLRATPARKRSPPFFFEDFLSFRIWLMTILQVRLFSLSQANAQIRVCNRTLHFFKSTFRPSDLILKGRRSLSHDSLYHLRSLLC